MAINQSYLEFSSWYRIDYQTSLLVSERDTATQRITAIYMWQWPLRQHWPKALSPLSCGVRGYSPSNPTICARAHVNKPLGSHSSIVANSPLWDTIAAGCGPLQRTLLPLGISLSKQDLWWSLGKDLWITGFHSTAKECFRRIYLSQATQPWRFMCFDEAGTARCSQDTVPERGAASKPVDARAPKGPVLSQIAVWPWGSCLMSLNKLSHLQNGNNEVFFLGFSWRLNCCCEIICMHDTETIVLFPSQKNAPKKLNINKFHRCTCV